MTRRSEPVYIVGYGDVGRRVAERWLDRGADVHALVRRPLSVSEHMHPGPALHRGDLDQADELPTQEMAGSRLYYFAPPPRVGDTDSRLRALLEALPAPPAKVVLISTTGVYGDCGGEWVDESRATNPGSDRARRRLDAEQALTAYAERHGVPLVILRVSGIYGPDRLPEKRLREATPMPAAADCGYTNRIHVEDLVEICVRAMEKAPATGIYNASDGSPGTMREYFDEVAGVLGYPRLPVVEREHMAATVNSRMMTYLGESRRIDNARVLAALDLTLKYPDLKAGLAAVRRETPGT